VAALCSAAVRALSLRSPAIREFRSAPFTTCELARKTSSPCFTPSLFVFLDCCSFPACLRDTCCRSDCHSPFFLPSGFTKTTPQALCVFGGASTSPSPARSSLLRS
jgi:hypothetical protein